MSMTVPVRAWRGLARTESGIAAVIRQSADSLTGTLDDVARWIDAGYPEAAAPLSFDAYEAELARVAPLFNDVYHQAAVITADGMRMVNVDFTAEAREWAGQHTATLVRQITDEQRVALRRIVADGIGRGQPVPTIAARVRQVVGLHERWSVAVDRYAQALYDAGRPWDEVMRMTGTYTNRLVKLRATNIARTETQFAMNAGRLEAWQKAVNRGAIGYDARKEWVAAAGERTCPICAALDGTQVGLTEAFDFGRPTPPAHPSCRCSIIVADVGTTYDQPDLNVALAEPDARPEWKPQMTVEEADAFTRGTKAPGAFYHGTTSSDVAQQIARVGFDDSKIGGNTGNR